MLYNCAHGCFEDSTATLFRDTITEVRRLSSRCNGTIQVVVVARMCTGCMDQAISLTWPSVCCVPAPPSLAVWLCVAATTRGDGQRRRRHQLAVQAYKDHSKILFVIVVVVAPDTRDS